MVNLAGMKEASSAEKYITRVRIFEMVSNECILSTIQLRRRKTKKPHTIYIIKCDLSHVKSKSYAKSTIIWLVIAKNTPKKQKKNKQIKNPKRKPWDDYQ